MTVTAIILLYFLLFGAKMRLFLWRTQVKMPVRVHVTTWEWRNTESHGSNTMLTVCCQKSCSEIGLKNRASSVGSALASLLFQTEPGKLVPLWYLTVVLIISSTLVTDWVCFLVENCYVFHLCLTSFTFIFHAEHLGVEYEDRTQRGSAAFVMEGLMLD